MITTLCLLVEEGKKKKKRLKGLILSKAKSAAGKNGKVLYFSIILNSCKIVNRMLGHNRFHDR